MDKGIIQEDLLENSIKKIELYQIEEKKTLFEINSLFKTINSNYNSDNVKYIDDVTFELANKAKVIKNIHDNDTYVLKNTIIKYKETAQKVAQDFRNMGDAL